MTINILTFGVRAVDANLLLNGYQQLNGATGPNELTSENLISTNGVPFQQLLLFIGQANDGDLNIDAGETAYNLSDMGSQDRVISLDAANTNDALRITAHGRTSSTALGDLTANIRYDNTIGFGLGSALDRSQTVHFLNAGDSLSFQLTQIAGVDQFLASVSFTVNVNGGGSEHVVIDHDGETISDGIDLGSVANGATVTLDFLARTIYVGASTRAMTDSEYLVFLAGGLNMLTIGSLSSSTQGFAIGGLTIASTDVAIGGEVIVAPPTGGLTVGTAEGDIIVGSAASDTINAGAGDDVIFGGGGADIIDGGDGNDVIEGGDGNDVLNGGAGNDVIVGGLGDDIMTGGGGADRFLIRSLAEIPANTDYVQDLEIGLDVVDLAQINGLIFIGDAMFSGTPGQVRFQVGAGQTEIQVDANGDLAVDHRIIITNGQFNLTETTSGSLVLEAKPITGTIGNDDQIDGTEEFNDLILALAGDDVVFAGGQNDTIYAGDGNDLVFGGSGNDILYGGAGNDFLRGDGGPAFIKTVGDTDGDMIYGGDGDDVMWGGDGQDTFDGGVGFDRVSFAFRAATEGVVASLITQMITSDGFGNAETMVSVEGLGAGTRFVDTLTGNDASNMLAGDYGDILVGNDGDDYFVLGAAPATLSGGSGIDTIALFFDFTWVSDSNNDGLADVVFTTTGVSIDMSSADNKILNDGFGYSANFTSIENVGGGFYDDIIIGDSNHNVLTGFSGNDILNGGVGVDTANYQENFALIGFTSDRLEGVDVNLAIGAGGTISGGEVDTLIDIENVIGTDFNDTITGDNNNNVLSGFGGDDVMRGFGGNDTLIGGDGNDQLRGEGNAFYNGPSGDDTLIGGAGDDIMWGGAGVDSFDGGDGFDRVSFFFLAATQGAVANLISQTISNDGFGNVETMVSVEGLGGGTAFADTLIGDDNANALFGDTGDTLIGNGGDDYFGLSGAPLILSGGAGVDTFDLDLGAHLIPDSNWDGLAEFVDPINGVIINMLTQTIDDDGVGGSGTFTGFENVGGSELGDTITGDNNNVLSGFGGDDVMRGFGGSDTLIGGAGADTFIFITAGGAGDIDRITDFSAVDDTIYLDRDTFGLTPGALSADAFHIGSEAGDANDRIIYDSETGALWFDADGSGAGVAIQFAILSPGLALTSDDFFGGP